MLAQHGVILFQLEPLTGVREPDSLTGALSFSGRAPSTPYGARFITTDPAGKFAYAASYSYGGISVYAMDSNNGLLTPFGSVDSLGISPALNVDPSGKFVYVVNAQSNNIAAYSINPDTGGLSVVGPVLPTGLRPSSVTITGTIR